MSEMAPEQLERDGQWLAEHRDELEDRYRGKWIAIWGQRVIGAGDTAVDAAREADRVAPHGVYLLESLPVPQFDV